MKPIILASGLSTRFEHGQKLVYPLKSISIIEQTIENCTSCLEQMPVVVCSKEVYEFLKTRDHLPPCILVKNNLPEKGMMHSIQIGLRSFHPSLYDFSVFLGDMPFIGASSFERIFKVFKEYEGKIIVFPQRKKVKGHPVLFPKSHIPEILKLPESEKGLQNFIQSQAHATINLEEDGFFKDIDSISDL